MLSMAPIVTPTPITMTSSSTTITSLPSSIYEPSTVTFANDTQAYQTLKQNNMNKLQTFEKQQVEKLAQLKTIPQYRAGDTLKVGIKVIEVKADDAKDKKKKTDKKAEAQAKERIQYFEGVLIAKKNRGVNSSVVLRKISNGEGVERLFKIYSPSVVSIEVIKRGVVKRAKLYYLRDLKGKKARIKEKLVGLFGSEVVAKPEVKQEANQPSE